VKVLDFGLAAVAPASAGDSDPTNSPTLTMAATQAGVIMGTAAYMSPEQASGRPVDKRADIWSFGVVLWELLTGHRLFEGETVSHTLADVLRGEIDVNKLPAGTPSGILDLIRRCLDRDVKTRLRDIGEARIVIQKYLVNPVVEERAPTAQPGRQGVLPWVLAAVFAVVALALALLHLRETQPAEHVLRYSIQAPEKTRIDTFALSPDGNYLAIAARGDKRMVRIPVLASTMGLLTLKKSAAMLLGYWLMMNWRNSGVSTVFVDDRMLDDDSPKNEPKKNVLFLITGPPTVPPNSFRRDAGRAI
jgi:serine/threonine-protein kinase